MHNIVGTGKPVGCNYMLFRVRTPMISIRACRSFVSMRTPTISTCLTCFSSTYTSAIPTSWGARCVFRICGRLMLCQFVRSLGAQFDMCYSRDPVSPLILSSIRVIIPLRARYMSDKRDSVIWEMTDWSGERCESGSDLAAELADQDCILSRKASKLSCSKCSLDLQSPQLQDAM